ncbi:MAG: FAD-dependent oxidoreductase [Candidatus Woesearchaeota archaeon]|jgi:thioredoxin-disulfide reductase|nr:FAD-dependent oxidoreductase [Candidatus Woesearchaeota archaeon]MDP7181261.1 FAD-dependent oxidoreductase [Candidatus Woesearchaeota archaeon]MDP7198120.1 FAD-dependent oxidoreductase [Candidatus Woesearchaeota archaeon]MDP7466954.1 FAD-dependent oxidoreductase [Candidatus Woesearchaeota archaeon]MDP7646960.1 FAD-dependent oxidoreductase [Candidatus Woesearchaeota archaeon]
MDYDVLVIGAGAAGMTAAMYTCRKKLKTAIISIDMGGQTNLTSHIENYPGTEPQSGYELMKAFKTNCEGLGCEFINGKVVKVEKLTEGFKVTLAHEVSYKAKTVIACFGKVPRSLGIPGEEKFTGRGVSSSVVSDGQKYKDKTVAIIGGGNSAFEGAIDLADIAKNVYLVHRRKEFNADEVSVEKVKNLDNVEMILDAMPAAIKGKGHVTGIVVKQGEEEKELQVEGVFIEIGFLNDPAIIKNLVEVNDKKEIVINDRCETKTPGLYCAGDATIVPFKQTVISAGEGAKAGLEAYCFITSGKGVTIDWTH